MVLDLLETNGEVSVAQLSARAGVSDMTIRRDLEALERESAVKRVHGGAITTVSRSYEPPYSIRGQRNVEAKQRIGKAAAALLSDGETVIVDVGTTTLEVARALQGRRHLTVLTTSMRAAGILAEEPGIRLMVTGGLIRSGELSLIGDLAERAFADFRFDTFLMGVAGIEAEAGLTEYNLDDARVKQAALASARRCVVVADSSKLGRVAFARICPLERVDVMVTDADASPEALAPLTSADVEVLTV
jgi:DeoR/GlpR family transcriptional regulator of sugar metabolism